MGYSPSLWLFDFPTVWNILFVFFFLPLSGTIFSQPPRLGRRILSVIQHLSAASSHVEWLSVTTLLNKHLLHASYDLSAHPSKAVIYSERGPASGSGFHHKCLMNSRDLYSHRQWSQAKSRGTVKRGGCFQFPRQPELDSDWCYPLMETHLPNPQGVTKNKLQKGFLPL